MLVSFIKQPVYDFVLSINFITDVTTLRIKKNILSNALMWNEVEQN